MSAGTRQVMQQHRWYADAKKKEGGKSKGGPQKVAGPGDFPMVGQWGPVNLDSITEKDVPKWAMEEVEKVYAAKPESPAPGNEDRKFFKLERKKRIKDSNQRKTLGILD